MKIQGTEQELKHLFREKRDGWFKISPKTMKSIQENRKMIILGCFLLLSIILIYWCVATILDAKYITTSECSQIAYQTLINSAKQSWTQQLWLNVLPMLKFLLLCLGISWVIHGVGFRLF